MTESTGKHLRDQLLLNNNKVVLRAKFETSTKSNTDKVMYTLHYGSILNLSSQLITDLYENQHALMDSTLFIPRILTYKCLNCSKEVIQRQCISSGRYCLIGHNEERVRPLDLFMESLREKCIYLQKTNSYRDDEHIFFTYLYHMRKDCYENKNTIKRKCAEDVMRSLDIDIDKVQ